MSEEKFYGIVIGDESQYKIVLETPSQMNESFFREVYKGAENNVLEIIESSMKKDDIMRQRTNSKLDRFKTQSSINNIIGFIGERGTGKTSSMLSFAAALADDAYKEKFQTEFVVTDAIDPTLINDNESIIQVIVAMLFLDVREEMTRITECNLNLENLVQQFDKVFKCLKNISSDKIIMSIAEMDTLEALNELASSSNLRKELEVLIKNYLCFKGKSKQSFLVIPIDDLDLNINNTEKMIEEIRKYLMLPNIIILLSAKFEQLVDSMEKAYAKEYKEILKENLENVPIQSMAIRYLEKLLPINRKNYMPNLMLEE